MLFDNLIVSINDVVNRTRNRDLAFDVQTATVAIGLAENESDSKVRGILRGFLDVSEGVAASLTCLIP